MNKVGPAWQRSWAFLFGLLGPAMVAWALYVVVELWPAVTSTDKASRRVAIGFGIGWQLESEQAFLVLAAVGGLLGGLLYTIGIYANRRSSGKFEPRDANWYWVRSIVGAGLGLAVYMLLRTGVFVMNGSSTSAPPTAYAVLALVMVAGLFTDKVLRKLSDVAGNFFSTKADAADHETAKPAAPAAPTDQTPGP